MKKTIGLYLVGLALALFTQAASPGISAGEEVRVMKIHPEIVSDTIERVCIQFSRFYRPELIGLEGDRPRVFIDIKDISRWAGPTCIAVGGRMILQVRSHMNPKTRTLRIVLDLETSKDYVIDQTYYTAGDIFCIYLKIDR